MSGGPVPVGTTGGTPNTYVYAAPEDCPAVCTICLAGCLFTASSGYSGDGKPNESLPYSTTPSGSQGTWLALDTTAVGTVPCVPGGGVGAKTGSLVTITGLTATYSSTTGTRVSSATSSCGTWQLSAPTPTTQPNRHTPSLAPSLRPVTKAPVPRVPGAKSFITLGDWGGAALGGQVS